MKGKDLSSISETEFADLQHVIDVDKWLASERAGRDLCGTMTWCTLCVKGEMFPCAKAQLREKMEQALAELEEESAFSQSEADEENAGIVGELATEELAAEDLSEVSEAEPSASEIPEGYERVVRYRRSFRSRIIQNEPVQDFYTEIKNALLGYAGVKSRVCQGSENFRDGKDKIAKLCVSGKTLSLFLALSPSAFEESKYRFEDVSDKKTHSETPLRIRITSRRMLKQAKELVELLARSFEIADVGCIYTDFHYAYRTDEELIRKGLIKPYTVLVKKKKK